MSENTKAQRIFLIRHGESEANVDIEKHHEKPDHLIELTPKGWQQALACGKFLQQFIESCSDMTERRFGLWHSSYRRARQTTKGIWPSIEKFEPRVYERDSISEIDYGLIDGLTDEEVARQHPEYEKRRMRDEALQTKHFLRMPGGESRADTSYRVRHLIESMQRKTREHGITDHIIVTHGLTLRVIVKEWLNLSYEATDREKNPNNCDVRLILRSPDNIGYLDGLYIYKKGKPKNPEPIRHPLAIERLRSDEFIPKFAKT